jgi:uroporphyrinogen III methyltransferase/synthase
MRKGFVYLVGAGPGDPGLITVKGMVALSLADCVVYDFLAEKSIIDKLVCEKIYVGKKGGDHTLPQEEINQLLVTKASEGKTVVRLKGGDPFIFGRGGEEAEILVENGIPFCVVPGVSSFFSAPAYAGIPVTHRDHADAFEVITGHKRSDAADDEDINFPEYSNRKTFVFLMGVKNLEYISGKLIGEKGFPPDTPAAVISWGTTPGQKAAVSSLSGISAETNKRGVKAPAIIIIGNVVLLRDKLKWFDTLPLFGKKIAVTRTREQASSLSSKLSGLGAHVIEFPTIEIRPKEDLSEIKNAISNIDKYDWIIFTSQNAVKVFFGVLKEMGLDSRSLGGRKIAAIGPATSKELERYFVRADFVPEEFIAESIIEGMKGSDITGKNILIPCSSDGKMGALVDRVHIYDSVIPAGISDEIESVKSADIITFTSSSTVNNFFKIVRDTDAILACIGPVTADKVREMHGEPQIIASEYTINGLVSAILGWFGKKR